MDYMMMATHFFGTAQDLTLNAKGCEYYVSISKGGFRYRDTEYEDDKFECAGSPAFPTYQAAAEFYCKLAAEFGAGNYDWEHRARFVREGEIA